jgi:SNF2 family DNA or RNA helicase
MDAAVLARGTARSHLQDLLKALDAYSARLSARLSSCHLPPLDFCPPLPSTLHANLYDYQLRGFHFLAQRARMGFGAILADEMGLGECPQSCS